MRLDNFIKEYINIDEGIEDKGIFKAVFMAGSSGSGKSYTLKKIKSGSIEPRIVNIDKFIEAGYTDTDKSKKLTVSQLSLYLNSMLPLFVDSTSSLQQAIITRYNTLENIGYDMAMIFVNTPLDVAIKRAGERKERYVDPEFVEKSYNNLQKMKGFLRSKFQLFIEVNNDGDVLNNKVILNTFKKISYFYTSSIRNPIGKANIETMKDNGWKYLTPNIYTKNELDRMAKMWFRSTRR